MKHFIKFIAVIILILLLNACDNKGGKTMTTDPDIMCGGTVDRSFDAPKVIKSKDLTAIDTQFFYKEKYGNRNYIRMHIKLEKNEQNQLVLSEKGFFDVSVKVGNEVLDGAQKLIEKLSLSKFNGEDKYTSGLPDPYSPVYFKAEYASGESIYFYVDGNPEELWCNELGDYFIDTFEKYGETAVLPKRESVQIVNIDIEYFDGTVLHRYCSILTKNDETKLLKSEFDRKANQSIYEKIIEIPENFYGELEAFLKDLNAYTLINGNNEGMWAAKTLGTKSFDIHLEHADHSQDMGSFEGKEITPEMLEKIQKIISFLDKYFENTAE